MEWDLGFNHNNKSYQVRVAVEYQDDKKMMVRVHGHRGTLLFECNYPLVRGDGPDAKVIWILREGKLFFSDEKERIRFEKTFLLALKQLLQVQFPAIEK